jgi:hypothetical protein
VIVRAIRRDTPVTQFESPAVSLPLGAAELDPMSVRRGRPKNSSDANRPPPVITSFNEEGPCGVVAETWSTTDSLDLLACHSSFNPLPIADSSLTIPAAARGLGEIFRGDLFDFAKESISESADVVDAVSRR